MAEFTKIIRIKNRICEEYSNCKKCPLANKENIFRCTVFADPEKAEQIILQYEKENPIKRYPTWNEWYSKTYPNADANNVCPRWFTHIENCIGIGCITCSNSEIPKEFAEKFGIEPIRIEV